MRERVILFCLIGAFGLIMPSDGECAGLKYDDFFTKKQMRLDFFHTGDAKKEIISLDEIREEEFYAGSEKNLIDNFHYGHHFFKVFDKKSGRLIYSRGFCSLFGEWQTTAEAKTGRWRSFHGSLIFPYPKDNAVVEIFTRDRKWKFRKKFSIEIDPKSHLISREKKMKDALISEIHITGPMEKRVDIVIIGDGYTVGEKEKFVKDAKRFAGIFFEWSPFREMKEGINIRGVMMPSCDSGTDEPRKGIFRETSANASFNTFDSARYLTTADNKRMRDLAGLVPYDTIVIMVNSSRYGGGGIYNLFSVFTSDNEFDEYLLIHEVGHGFAGLGDEYYTSQVAYSGFYPRGIEPWEPNITALLDRKNVKWKKLMKPGTPCPTPLPVEKGVMGIGCYEGAGYSAKGLFRPAPDCKMFSKGHKDFCEVCMDAVKEMIKFFVD